MCVEGDGSLVEVVRTDDCLIAVADVSGSMSDHELVLRDVRALLDQLQLDREQTLTMRSNLTEELGVDSLALVELCDQFERTFDVVLSDDVFLNVATPEQWLRAIEKAKCGTTPTQAAAADSYASPDRNVTARLHKVVGALRATVLSRRTRSAGVSPPTKNERSRTRSNHASLLFTIYAWALLIPFALTIWLLAVLPLSLERRRVLGCRGARTLCRALRLSVRVEGAVPDGSGAMVVAANHASFIDGLALYVFVDEPLTFVASADMEHQFLLGRIMRGFGCVFVERGRAERSAESVAKMVETIRSGRSLIVFPEGAISVRPGLRVFRLGAFETATSSDRPVVPVGIRGSRGVLRPGSFRPSPGEVRILIGEPIRAHGNEFVDRVSLRDEVRTAIATLSAEPDA